MYRTVYWNNVTSFEATCYLPLLFAERARCAAIAGYFSKLDVPRSLQSGGHLSKPPVRCIQMWETGGNCGNWWL